MLVNNGFSLTVGMGVTMTTSHLHQEDPLSQPPPTEHRTVSSRNSVTVPKENVECWVFSSISPSDPQNQKGILSHCPEGPGRGHLPGKATVGAPSASQAKVWGDAPDRRAGLL